MAGLPTAWSCYSVWLRRHDDVRERRLGALTDGGRRVPESRDGWSSARILRPSRATGTGRPWVTLLLRLMLALVPVLGHADIAAASGSLAPQSDAATTDSLPTLTLAVARRLAYERNWDLLAARSEVDAATARRIVAREFPNPNLSLSTTKIPANRGPASTPSGNALWDRNYDTTAAIGQLFEIGGKRASRRAVAAAGLRGAEARLADARRVLDLGVLTAYVAVLQASKNVRILHDSVDSLRKEAEIAQRRLNAGDISPSDRSQIEVAALRLESEARSAEAAARQARIQLLVLIGESNPTGDWIPADALGSLVEDLPAEGPLQASGQRPDLAAALAGVDRADAQLRLERAQRVPDPTISMQYEHEPPDQPQTLGLAVSLPLPLWNRNRGNIAAAHSARQQAENEVRRTTASIAAEVAAARTAYLAARARREQYATEIAPGSANVRRTVALAYEKGGASLLDLLSAERSDNEIRLATAQATADAVLAAAGLRSALNLPLSPSH